MILLSLDQASRTSGYAVFMDDNLIAHGTFTIDDHNTEIRLVKIKNKLLDLIKEYNPDYVIFEDIQQQNNVANNVQTFKVLAEVYGIISLTLAENALPHESVLATSWKSALQIKGRAREEQKKNAQKYVQETYNIKTSQDGADAICIGAAYLKKNKSAWSK